MENKTITVKGVGSAKVQPDYVVIGMTLISQDIDYSKALETATSKLNELTNSIASVGLKKEDLKTTNFNVGTDYKSKQRRDGTYERILLGYVVRLNLKLSFDFDNEMLSQVLRAISSTAANLDLQISFTVKDATGVKEELLRSAAENAKRKAEILCSASGVELGDLQTINYNWAELDVYSRTTYNIEEETLLCAPMSVDIEPDDIDVSDTVTFVWGLGK